MTTDSTRIDIPPATYTAADVLAVLATEDVQTAIDAGVELGIAVDVALLQHGAALRQTAKLIHSARFSYRGDATIAEGVARNLAHRAPHSAFVPLVVGEHAGHPLYCWVGLRRRYHGRR